MAAVTTTRRRVSSDERRQLILQAAAGQFGRLGFAAARLEDIAADAGVTKPIVYRHFDSKEALYLALLERHETDLPTFVAGEGPLPMDEQLVQTILEGWLDYVRDNSHAWLMLFRDGSGGDEIQAVRLRVSRTARAVMAGFVERRDRPLPADQVQATAETLTSGLAGLALWWIDNPETPKAVVLEVATRMSAPAFV